MAITLDTAAAAYRGTSASTHTFSFTVAANTNRALAIFVHAFDGDRVTSVTYGGTAMTQVNKVKKGTEVNYTYMYYLVAPSTGANDFVVSMSPSERISWAAVSLYNVVQEAIAVNNTTGGNGESSSLSMTSTVDNSWHVIGVMTNIGTLDSRSNYTSDAIDGSNGATDIGHQLQATAGTLSQGATWTGSTAYGSNGIVVKPAADPASVKDLIGMGIIPFAR